jgi:hypothetical protein
LKNVSPHEKESKRGTTIHFLTKSPCPYSLYAFARYDVAAIATGYSIEDPAEFASRITALMSSSTGGFSTAAASSSSSASSEPSEPEAKPQEVTAEVVEEES